MEHPPSLLTLKKMAHADVIHAKASHVPGVVDKKLRIFPENLGFLKIRARRD
jgi:hypothetical protein